MTEAFFIPKDYSKTIDGGAISYRAPSNIALVKYWGKHGQQLPRNASISFTLQNCHTITVLHYEKKQGNDFKFEVYLEGKREKSFEPKILTFLQRADHYLPFLRKYQFKIETTNSFPHSSGIASSASGMSALALCLMEMERLMNPGISQEDFDRKASFLARLGSGSASRSIEGPLVVWGAHPKIEGSSDLFSILYPYPVHHRFMNFQDTILLVDKGEKKVSSTVGHGLMNDHPFAEQRFEQANKNLARLIHVLEAGDLDQFVEIVELEALQLHAMMLVSKPSFVLMKPNTLQIIERIRDYRLQTNSKLCFTLDAGANVHALYPEHERSQVLKFIESDLKPFCMNGEYIQDYAGTGAVRM